VGYLIAILLVVVVLVAIIRLLIYILSGLVAVLAGIAHAVVGFFAAFGLRIVVTVVAIGLLWAGWWLISELCYLLWDRRAEQQWFKAIVPRIEAAMSPGNAYSVAGLRASPRAPGFGRRAEHRLTPPLPSFLQLLVDAGTQTPGWGDTDLAADKLGLANTAEPTLSFLSSPITRRSTRSAVRPQRRPEPEVPEGKGLNSLATHSQLRRVRELIGAGTRQSIGVRVLREDAAPSQQVRCVTGAGSLTRSLTSLASPLGQTQCHRHAVSSLHRVRPADRGRTVVTGSNGAQVGDRCRQYNLYTYNVTTPKLADLADRLRDRDVVAATRRLAADPQNPEARRALLNKLSPGGMRLGGPTSKVEITVMRGQTTRSASWLDGTVFFRDVSGGQIGDGNRQRNEFVHTVAPTKQVRELLAANPKLAKAVIDCTFPERGRGDAAKVGRELKSAVEGMHIEPHDGRVRSAHYDPPGPGETLQIRAYDGVSVGEQSRVWRTDDVNARLPSGFSSRSGVRRIAATTAREAPVRPAASSLDHGAFRQPTATSPSRATRGISALD
jgi:hypothetical protein